MPKCKVCKEVFTRSRPLQSVCSPICAIALAQTKREQADRKIYKVKKESLKTRSDYMKEAQAALNAWIRLVRDNGEPCISCGRHHTGQYHAGHYRSRGAMPMLALEPRNIHKQCSVCNNHKSGNLTEYRINLLKKVGQAEVEWLEGPHDARKYTIDDLIEIRDKYRALVNEAKKIPPD
jgi:hypothetical protein